MKKNRKYGLEEWLINFAITVIKLVDKLPNTMAPNYHSWQLTRSGISPAQIYGEALGAETKNYFIHKLKIVFKKQREYHVHLKISERFTSSKSLENMRLIADNCNKLISFILKSIETTKSGKVKNNS